MKGEEKKKGGGGEEYVAREKETGSLSGMKNARKHACIRDTMFARRLFNAD